MKTKRTETTKPRATRKTTGSGGSTRQARPANNVEPLLAALRDHLSPGAVALLASCLGVARANDPNVEREVFWLRDTLIENLLGGEEYCRLLDELGL